MRVPPWWLVPNLLALDAPAVAVVWQRFLGDAVPVAASVVLGLTVWGVYLADRALDSRRAHATDRHRFAARHFWAFAALAPIALAAAGTLAWLALPVETLTTGAGVAAAVGVYFAAVHAGRLPGGKEVVVGTLFGVGVGLTAAAGPAVVAFAGLCVANCALISRWESAPDRPAAWLPAAAAAVAGVASGFSDARVSLAVAAALLLLGVLHLVRRRLGQAALRVLADAALLTPLLA
jgi:hypothetical protein